jgi:hypothetical protein
MTSLVRPPEVGSLVAFLLSLVILRLHGISPLISPSGRNYDSRTLT